MNNFLGRRKVYVHPSLWRMKRFADSVPEMGHLQREMNRGYRTHVDLLMASNISYHEITSMVSPELSP